MLTITKSQHSKATYVNNFFANFVACEYSCLSLLLSDLQSHENPTNCLFKDCEHAKLRVGHSTDFLVNLLNIRFADETLKLFIQTWEHAKPRLVISRITLYLDL